MPSVIESMSCPCGSGAPLARCCGAILDGAPAPTAEALMRSRYTAHVVGRIDYIVATHDAATRAGIDRAAVERWARESTWLGLQIIARDGGGSDEEVGVVEFKAAYRAGAIPLVHHERSRFRRVDGRWVYVDGERIEPPPPERALAPPRPRAVAIGRNDRCPCGSGKKYKRCCGA